MAADLLEIALRFLAEYGLIAIFILLVLDGAMLMPVLPGEAVMIMAVTQYVSDMGDLVFMIALTTAAGVVGSLLLYTIARVGGRPLIERHPRLFMMDRRRREKMEETFEKPLGQSLVMFLRVIPLTRIIVNIPAGVARMPVGRFLAFSTAGLALFHGGFLWLAWEYNQPGSPVAQQATSLQDAYATPAWEFLQTNELIAILGAVLLGAYLSFKSSKRMLKYPAGSVVSILGWIATRALFFGSLVIGGLLAYDPQIVYEWAIAGGVDLPRLAAQLNYETLPFLGYSLGIAWCLGMILLAFEKGARRRKARVERMRKRQEASSDQGDDQGSQDSFEPARGGSDVDFEETSG